MPNGKTGLKGDRLRFYGALCFINIAAFSNIGKIYQNRKSFSSILLPFYFQNRHIHRFPNFIPFFFPLPDYAVFAFFSIEAAGFLPGPAAPAAARQPKDAVLEPGADEWSHAAVEPVPGAGLCTVWKTVAPLDRSVPAVLISSGRSVLKAAASADAAGPPVEAYRDAVGESGLLQLRVWTAAGKPSQTAAAPGDEFHDVAEPGPGVHFCIALEKAVALPGRLVPVISASSERPAAKAAASADAAGPPVEVYRDAAGESGLLQLRVWAAAGKPSQAAAARDEFDGPVEPGPGVHFYIALEKGVALPDGLALAVSASSERSAAKASVLADARTFPVAAPPAGSSSGAALFEEIHGRTVAAPADAAYLLIPGAGGVPVRAVLSPRDGPHGAPLFEAEEISVLWLTGPAPVGIPEDALPPGRF